MTCILKPTPWKWRARLYCDVESGANESRRGTQAACYGKCILTKSLTASISAQEMRRPRQRTETFLDLHLLRLGSSWGGASEQVCGEQKLVDPISVSSGQIHLLEETSVLATKKEKGRPYKPVSSPPFCSWSCSCAPRKNYSLQYPTFPSSIFHQDQSTMHISKIAVAISLLFSLAVAAPAPDADAAAAAEASSESSWLSKRGFFCPAERWGCHQHVRRPLSWAPRSF